MSRFVDTAAAHFIVSIERAEEIVGKYAIPTTDDFVDNKIDFGTCVSSFMNIDDLTTNEKCFLTHIVTYKLMEVIQDIARKRAIKGILEEIKPSQS